MNMTLMPHYKRDYAVWIAAIGCQCARRIHSDLAQCCGKTMKAAKLTELDDQLCGGKASYEARPVKAAGSWPCERLSRVVDTSEEQSHHVLWRDNRNCPAP